MFPHNPNPNPNLYQLICPYVRAVFEKAQENRFNRLEGVVFVKCCDAMLRLYDLWKVHLPNQRTYILTLPKIQSFEAIRYFAGVLRRFSEVLGTEHGSLVTDQALGDAILEQNQLRMALRKLYRMRLNNPLFLPYSKLCSLIRDWLSVAPAQALPGVEKELKAFEEIPSEKSSHLPKVVISSSTLDQIEIVEIIERAGMTVIADDHCCGLRHFDDLVSEDGDPYLNLAERYLSRWPCPRMQANPSHLQRLIQEIDEVGANGVIYVGLKYCDQSGFELPRLQTQMREHHIPFLSIEHDYTATGLAQLKVRIEAFAEILSNEFGEL
jgi:benzoyl-CoA reductase/2-hydroxyglutaryl-CoA dehydratase subunit BcrC/BadD/HgdB